MKARTAVGGVTSSGSRRRLPTYSTGCSTGCSTGSSTRSSTGCSSTRGSACLATCRSTVGTAARIVSSRERAAGAVGASGVGSASAGTAWAWRPERDERGTGGVSRTCGTSTSTSGSTGSTSRALSRCSGLRVSTAWEPARPPPAPSLPDRAHDDGFQPCGGSRSRSLPAPVCCGAFAADLRTPKVEGASIRAADQGVALDRGRRDGSRRHPRGTRPVRRRVRGALQTGPSARPVGGPRPLVVGEPATEEVVRLRVGGLGFRAAMISKVRRPGASA